MANPGAQVEVADPPAGDRPIGKFEELLAELSATFMGLRAEAVDDHVEESLRVVGEFAGADSVTVAATGSSRAAGRPPTGSVSARARCATG
jgi:hypothetical protein